MMGLIIGTFAFSTPEFMSLIPEDKPDYMIPIFIINYLPHGIIGLLLVAILAAAMSSLSSAINSLSAASVEDFIVRAKGDLSDEQSMFYSKLMTVIWGVICIILAFSAGNIATTVIEAINKVGSAFYGPIVATFILAILTKKTHAVGVNIGLILGVVVNIIIWRSGAPIFWIWWNFIGAAITLSVGYGASLLIPAKGKKKEVQLDTSEMNFFTKENYLLVAYFVFIIWFSMSLADWI